MNEDQKIIAELDRTILALVELRKYLARKKAEKKIVYPMKEFLAMLRKETPSFRKIIDELERFRQENSFDGVILSAGLYGVENPPTNIWWTALHSIDDLIDNRIDVVNLVDVLSHENRLHILKFLSSGRKTYKEIANYLQLEGGAFAHHATPLLRMKCITKKGRGNYQITELGWEILATILFLSTRINQHS